MAKLFYTVDEAAAKLGMSPGEVKGVGESGQLQEFRDKDRLMFKKEQVDLLAGGGDDDDVIQLADSSAGLEPISLSSSGSGSAFNIAPASSRAGDTGISIFDPDEAAADASSDTIVSSGGIGMSFDSDSAASGSGLANLALEPDDTSLGSDLLAGIDEGEKKPARRGGGGGGNPGSSRASLLEDSAAGFSAGAGESAIGAVPAAVAGGALFEGVSDADASNSMANSALIPVGEAYDGAWSGIVGGLMVGATLLTLVAIAVLILSMSGGAAALAGITQGVLWGVLGGGLVLVLVCAAVGWVLLRKT
jgi:hypothetical protein